MKLLGIVLCLFSCIAYSHQKPEPWWVMDDAKNLLQDGWDWIKSLTSFNFKKWYNQINDIIYGDTSSSYIEKARKALKIDELIVQFKTRVTTKATCFACKTMVRTAYYMIQLGKTNEEILKFFTKVCTTFRLQNTRVCYGAVHLIGKNFIEAIRGSPMTANEICGLMLFEACPDEKIPSYHEWSVKIPPPTEKTKPHLTQMPHEKKPVLKILQLSDLHFDSLYREGANADCEEPLCCREIHGAPKTWDKAAGKFGAYSKCDTPLILFENILKHIASVHMDVDYILWTGDVPPHDIYEQTKKGNLRDIRIAVELISRYFNGIQIYPTVGNHESCPLDNYVPPNAPTKNNITWLYNELNKHWSQWLPSETSSTISRGAFYSVLVKPGFRIIAVNGNYCSRINFWLLRNSTDPAGHLAWLVDELTMAEANDEKVHIIGHVPPGGEDCLKVWSRNYNLIIERFQGIIMAQFFGHTHFDEFEVFYDNNYSKKPINIGFISPSVTPWEYSNPSYRIYYVDGDHPETTRAIINLETWKMDLDYANDIGTPIWYRSYCAKEAYNMSSLLPKDWDNLITRMKKDSKLFDEYHRNYYRKSPVMPICNNACKKKLICDLRNSKSGNRKLFCNDIYDAAVAIVEEAIEE